MNDQKLIKITIARVNLLQAEGRIKPLALNGFKAIGRGAIILNHALQPQIYYIKRDLLSARLLAGCRERHDRCIEAVDSYDPTTEAIVVGFEDRHDCDPPHGVQMTTLMVKLNDDQP